MVHTIPSQASRLRRSTFMRSRIICGVTQDLQRERFHIPRGMKECCNPLKSLPLNLNSVRRVRGFEPLTAHHTERGRGSLDSTPPFRVARRVSVLRFPAKIARISPCPPPGKSLSETRILVYERPANRASWRSGGRETTCARECWNW